MTPIICAKPSPPRGRSPSFPTTRHGRSYPLEKHLYTQRHLVECCFSKLKQFRRVATRFEKDRPKLPRRRHSRSHHLMDAISVHAT
jgi:transposase